jgi:hypothetical protein
MCMVQGLDRAIDGGQCPPYIITFIVVGCALRTIHGLSGRPTCHFPLKAGGEGP